MTRSRRTARSPPTRPATSGDGVAVVVAASRALAEDAAELVEVDYEPLPAVTDLEPTRVTDAAPLVHDEFGTNTCLHLGARRPARSTRLFADAAVTVKERYRQQRLIPNAMEPRGVLVQPTPATASTRCGRRRRSRTSPA